MLIHPQLRALRSNDAPQRLAQARLGEVFAGWRETPAAATAEAELERFHAGAALDDLPLLSVLFAEGDGAARTFCDGLVGAILGELARDPIGQSPLRHYTDDTLTTLTILRRGTTTLTLQAIDGAGLARRPAPTSASFAPCETWEHVLAGGASARRIVIGASRPGGADLEQIPVSLDVGDICHRRGPQQTLVIDRAPAGMVTLKLQRRFGCGDETREYSLEDGTLLHVSAGSPRDSRLELSAALLGRMGRRDAAPLLAAMAEEQGAAALRWQALRESLALDSGEGFAALCRIARNAGDPLAGPAGALRGQLLEAHPQLARIDRCPA